MVFWGHLSFFPELKGLNKIAKVLLLKLLHSNGKDKLKNKQGSKINLDNYTYRSSKAQHTWFTLRNRRKWSTWALVSNELKVVRELGGHRVYFLAICRLRKEFLFYFKCPEKPLGQFQKSDNVWFTFFLKHHSGCLHEKSRENGQVQKLGGYCNNPSKT